MHPPGRERDPYTGWITMLHFQRLTMVAKDMQVISVCQLWIGTGRRGWTKIKL